jgi:hypothetical protein
LHNFKIDSSNSASVHSDFSDRIVHASAVRFRRPKLECGQVLSGTPTPVARTRFVTA